MKVVFFSLIIPNIWKVIKHIPNHQPGWDEHHSKMAMSIMPFQSGDSSWDDPIWPISNWWFSNSTAIVYQRANRLTPTPPPFHRWAFCFAAALPVSLSGRCEAGTPWPARLPGVGSANASRWSTTAEPHGSKTTRKPNLESVWAALNGSLWHEIWQHIYGRAKQNPKPINKNRQKCKQK